MLSGGKLPARFLGSPDSLLHSLSSGPKEPRFCRISFTRGAELKAFCFSFPSSFIWNALVPRIKPGEVFYLAN
jgi:hypothetical protein